MLHHPALRAVVLNSMPRGNDRFTTALLHFDGADASTTLLNHAAGGSQTFTALGDAQIDTAQFKFGGSAALLDGTGDAIRGDGSSESAFGTGDFTIDFWIRFASVASAQLIYDSRPDATQGLYPTIYLPAGGAIRYFTNSADQITGAVTIATNTWYHIAVARRGTSTKLFVNGTQDGSTYSDSNNYINGASRPAIGANGNASGSVVSGWIDELRISKGIARWTENFVPPDRAYA